jgi:multiple sugar transport system ATP-binding protein
MVFQNNALYPNKTVHQNHGFPLRMRKLSRRDIDAKVREAAKLLDITHLLERRPRELSGGQQQRVALGRALVRDPQVFLMDEPLSNLDAKLRVQMRAELKRFHTDLNATVVYVTHDQLEAMTMADRIAVMQGGVLQQYDTPERVFEEPANTFVAGFVGSPAMNLLDARLDRAADGAASVAGAGWTLALDAANSRRAAAATGAGVVLGVRHSTLTLHLEDGPDRAAGRVYTVEPTGDLTYAHVNLGASVVVVSTDPQMKLRADQPVWIEFDQRRLHLFDAETRQRLLPAA